MVLIHEKITALLQQRRLKKRDLARALGVSPQTATDICKGRSAITLPHLRNLVSFFEIRADFWLDDDRLMPSEVDQVCRRDAADAMQRTGLLAAENPARLVDMLRAFAIENREAFLQQSPALTDLECNVLGLSGGIQKAAEITERAPTEAEQAEQAGEAAAAPPSEPLL